jgi:hypothetical protein
MKESFLFAFMLIFSTFGFGQTYLLEEYFNDPVKLPSTWTSIDKDGDKQNWRIETADTEFFAVSDSWRSGGIGPLRPENYLVSPKIDLTALSGTVTLRYVIRITDPEFFQEHYKVSVSTTGNKAADFTTIVKEETCTEADYYENFPYWHARIVDLTPFIGQNIFLSWCHFSCTNIYNISLDSIQVSYSTNVGLAEREQSNVTIYPNPVSEEILVSGSFENAELQLFTTDGRQIYQSKGKAKQVNINVSGFESGIYFLKIKSPEGIITRKVYISH